MTVDIIGESFAPEQAVISQRLDEILDACRMKDFPRLAGYHLPGPKFSKFDDAEPFDRQDAQTAMQAEIDGFSRLDEFDGYLDGPKIDVFGQVAVVTGIFRCTFRLEGNVVSIATRTTLVFVDDRGDWLIAHEHHSPFTGA